VTESIAMSDRSTSLAWSGLRKNVGLGVRNQGLHKQDGGDAVPYY
jgi:hypothetical protein